MFFLLILFCKCNLRKLVACVTDSFCDTYGAGDSLLISIPDASASGYLSVIPLEFWFRKASYQLAKSSSDNSNK
jgi:hypothetical protein